ncbi:cytochrome P450 2K1-like isoform X2 [Thunnus thynnus]|uniref:cytochrome P450 2K1-like isoform X2 n=1 Tax=Thunnus thynnus TaxID=8237 RepID=UPI003529B7B3
MSCLIGILFANGESWKEMRRFALSTLRDFGMGKRVAEDKILEECCHLIQMFDEHKGKPFDTTHALNYATSNIISSIVYGSRFEYSDPRFKNLVRRAKEIIRITGSTPVQLYNMFPRLFSWIKNRQLILKNVEMNVRDVKDLIKHLKETLNPHMCRGLVDCFLIRKQNLFSSPTTLLGAVAVVLFLCLVSSSFTSQEIGKEPPGPRPLPLFGNLLQLDLKRPHTTLCKLSKKYGSVFTVYFGPKKVVVLAGYKTVKQALVNHAVEFGDREISPVANDFSSPHGVLFSNGEFWQEMRRFALSNLRDFGMGKTAAENRIVEEIQYLIQVFEQHQGKPFDTTQSINYAVSNVISTIVYGSRFEYNDPEFTCMVDRANENIRLSGSPSIQLYNIFPWMGKWTRNRMRIRKNVADNREQIRQLIRPLQETLNTQVCRGFVDSFLAHREKLEDAENKDSCYNTQNLLSTVSNIFAAGTDTTGTTLRWALLLMVKYPDIQDQVQGELSRVVGNRQIRVEDRKNLPYTNAVIHETQRMASILPMSLPHTTSKDVNFQGYFIRKGTTVYPLLASVLWDESEWESPHTFNPAHFLDKDGKFVKRDAFMPFSAGRRVCLGESLARMELFLFFTSLLQRFRFTPPPGVKEDDLDLTPVVGFTLNPSPHKLCAVVCI